MLVSVELLSPVASYAQDLCSWNFALFRIIGRIGDLVEPFDRCIMRSVKQVQAKQQVMLVKNQMCPFLEIGISSEL